MTDRYYLSKSSRAGKKYMVNTPYGLVHFGAEGYKDYTMHKDSERKQRYIDRHQAREDWSETGLNTAGFWSRWLLWNKPSISASIKDIEKTFHIKILLPSCNSQRKKK